MKRASVFLLLVSLTGCEILPFPKDRSPTVESVSPSDGDANVTISADINAALNLPNGGVDLTSVGEQSARLTNTATGAVVEARVSVDNDTQTLTLDPASDLELSTNYRFTVTSALQDVSGKAFTEYTSTFTTIPEGTPFVVGTDPADGATDVSLSTSISTTEIKTDGGVDIQSITEASVYLVKVESGERVEGQPGTSGGGDSIILVPEELEPRTEYQFNVTSAVRDVSGQAFAPYNATFTTGTEGDFEGNIQLTPQPPAAGLRHSSMEFTPDGNFLYATTIIGEIKRYPVGSDGTLGTPQTFNSLIEAEGGPRLTVGLALDPASTLDNPIVWVTHTYVDPANFNGSVGRGIIAPWTGKLTRLSGPNLENVQDVVIGLPRSNKDHVTNSVAFNPAEPGVVYFVQGSNTAMGAPDNSWGYQPERALSGAVLRLDTNLLGNNLPLNAQTEDGGTYDPFAPNAPLTVYASGLRNSYDLVWHSNGNLYVPANGSAAGGNTPRYDPIPGTCENRIDGRPYTGPTLEIDSPSDVPDATYDSEGEGWEINQTLPDFLFKIEEGGYYGTPNPKRCEWVLNGGGKGFPGYPKTKVSKYPASVSYDPNYRGPTFDFGKSVSPNGSIEYTGNRFSGLKGKLLVTRFGQYDDVVALAFDGNGDVTGQTIVARSTDSVKIVDPIEIAESPTTGYLYVAAYDWLSGEAAPNAGIILLRP